MNANNWYRLLADIVVVAHLAYVLFVILGLVAIFIGYLCHWPWVRNRWFRSIHLAMIGIVVFESLMSITCPLTTLENWLRLQAGQTPSGGSFVARCVHGLMFYPFSPQFFTLMYCAFASLVMLAWILVPIRWRKTAERA